MILKVKNWLACKNLDKDLYEKKLKNRAFIYELVLDFSLFPQIIAAAVVYLGMRGESALLLDRELSVSYFLMFIELIVISFVSVFVRRYFMRYLIFAIAVQMIISAFASGYVISYFRVFSIAALSVIAAAVNICALYGSVELKHKGE